MYTVYDVKTTMAQKTYKTPGAAKAGATRLNKKKPGAYDWASNEDYNKNVVYMVEKRNAMNGQLYMEPSNTPYYASASSETYWCS